MLAGPPVSSTPRVRSSYMRRIGLSMTATASVARFTQFFSSLKFKVVALTVATAVLAAVASTELALDRTRADLERLMLERERDDGQRLAALLASKLELLQVALRAVAGVLTARELADPASATRVLVDKPALGALFDTLFMARADGTMIMRLENGKPMEGLPQIADRDYFREVMATGQIVVSSPLLSRVNNAPIVIVAAAVLGADGSPIGVLGGSLALQSTGLFAQLTDANAEKRSRLVVMDRQGVVLAHSDPSRVLTDAALEPGLAEEVGRWRGSGSPIDTRAAVTLSREYLVSLVGIPLSNWVLAHVTPKATALAPLAAAERTARLATWGAGLAAACIAGLLAWHLTRPISRLQRRAEGTLENDADDVRAWPAERGEVGRLAESFKQILTQRQLRQEETQALLQKLEAVLDHAEVGIVLTRDGRFELVSDRLCRVFERPKAQWIGQPTRTIYPSDEAFRVLAESAGPALTEHGSFDTELELVRATGEVFWARMRGRAVAPGDRSQGTIWTIEDVTLARGERERLAWSSSHDSLTGLANRGAFEVLLEQATRRAAREPSCALFIDLDRFKQVNDTAGHAAGDALLQGIAQALVGQVRKSDTVARLGGDEFAVLLNACPLPHAKLIAEKIRAAVVAYTLDWEGSPCRVGASIGLVAVDGHLATPADVMRAADAACYAAKRDGRNRVALHAEFA